MPENAERLLDGAAPLITTRRLKEKAFSERLVESELAVRMDWIDANGLVGLRHGSLNRAASAILMIALKTKVDH